MGLSGDAAVSSGLTPNVPLEPANPFASLNNMASPFSIFGNGGSGTGMGDLSSNLDWVSSCIVLYRLGPLITI
jgi:hypothetical protein